MLKSKFSESQRLAILAEQDGGKNVEDICRHYQISPATASAVRFLQLEKGFI